MSQTRVWEDVFHGSKNAAEKFLADQNLSKSKFASSGSHDYFRCRNWKKYACRVQFKVSPTTSGVVVAQSLEHIHDEATAKHKGIPGLSNEVKITLKKALEDELLPSVRNRKVDAVLAEAGEKRDQKKQKQIDNYLADQRRQNKCHALTIGECEMFCQKHAAGEGAHDAFVPSYEVHDGPRFFLPMTSRYLLQNASRSQYLACDATYNVTSEEFPLLVAGVIDGNGRYHPIAYALVADDESTACYKQFFWFLHQQLPDWVPKFTMADGSPAVTAAALEVFPDATRLMCHFHVSQKVDKKGGKLYGTGWEEMKEQYLQLQLAHNDQVFAAAAELFLRDLVLEGHAEFATYFDAQWIRKLKNWFEGAMPGYPSTNNANESVNGHIKKELKKAPLGGFLQKLLNVVQDASANSEKHGYAVEPPLTLLLETKGFSWANEVNVAEDILKEDSYLPLSTPSGIHLRRQTIYYVKASTNDGYSFTRFKEVLEDPTRLNSFKEYMQWRMSFYIITKNVDLGRLFCSCPSSLKHYACKHVIGLRLLHEKDFDVRPAAKTTLINGKRQRGRPKKN